MLFHYLILFCGVHSFSYLLFFYVLLRVFYLTGGCDFFLLDSSGFEPQSNLIWWGVFFSVFRRKSMQMSVLSLARSPQLSVDVNVSSRMAPGMSGSTSRSTLRQRLRPFHSHSLEGFSAPEAPNVSKGFDVFNNPFTLFLLFRGLLGRRD